MKAGDSCITPDGIGTIAHFEVYGPLEIKENTPPYFTDEADPNMPEGWFVRAGVTGCHPTLDVAYYPLDQINPIPKGDPQ
jgi:hypothetical protein